MRSCSSRTSPACPTPSTPVHVGGSIAFLIYLVAGVAEANRAPFDLPEAESDGGGYTEYSGLKWAMFFMAEYINMVNISALATVLFLGGLVAGGLAGTARGAGGGRSARPHLLSAEAGLVHLPLHLAARTLPRLRFDRLMNLGWKVLFPLALANLILTAFVVALWPAGAWPFS